MEDKFLGRRLNTNTMMWEFADGSGVALPEELRQQMLCDIQEPIGGTIVALDRKWRYEEAAKSNAAPKELQEQ